MSKNKSILVVALLALASLAFFAPIRFTQLERAGTAGQVPITGANGIMAYRTMSALSDSLSVYIDGVVSSFEQNDSVFFLTNNGENVYSGIDGLPSHGRILYVNETAYKGAGTQKVGRIDLPFRDPWQARDSAVSGDLVILMTGDYRYGDPACVGCDFTANTTSELMKFSLMKNNVTYYSYPNVKFTGMTTNHGRLFYDTTGVDTKFFGHAVFTGKSSGGIVQLFHHNSKLVLEADQLIYNDETAWGVGLDIRRASKAHFKIRNVDVTLYQLVSLGHSYSGSNFDTLENCNFLLAMDDFRDNKSDAVFVNRGIIDSSQVVVVAKNVSQDIAYGTYVIPFRATTNSNFIWLYDNAVITRETQTTIFGAPNITGIFCYQGSLDVSNSTYTFKVNNLNTDLKMFHNIYTSTTALKGGSVTVDIQRGIYRGTSGFVNVQGTSGGTPPTVYVNGNIYTETGNTMFELNGTWGGTVVVSGNYRVATAGQPVVSSSTATSKILFKDAVLANDATVASLQASVARNVVVMGCYSNSVLLDTDVTELGQNIVRNSNYLY